MVDSYTSSYLTWNVDVTATTARKKNKVTATALQKYTHAVAILSTARYQFVQSYR